MTPAMDILGIVNITRDSFSDGGRFLAPERAVAHAQLMADGAALVDLGAESTHPDAEDVSAEEEIARLTPVLRTLRQDGVRVSCRYVQAGRHAGRAEARRRDHQ